jgi:hypothetical protein
MVVFGMAAVGAVSGGVCRRLGERPAAGPALVGVLMMVVLVVPGVHVSSNPLGLLGAGVERL